MIEPLAGKLIDDRYEIIRRLGEGGMGTVYLAAESELNRIVAIKMLHHGLLADEEHRARFEREGKILSSLSHPNILKFYRFGLYQNQQPYIVMEYLQGRTLTEFMEADFPGLDQCLRIVFQTIEGLHFAHEHQIVHRDIKPANVFIQDDAQVKLVDFGLARIVDDSRRQHLTQTGELIGSVFYMSPEQCVGKAADSRSDIYSCGCLIYEMFAGQPPFTADNPIGLMHLHANASIPSIAESQNAKVLDKDVVRGLDCIVSKSMEKNPDERYQDMLALKADLALLQQGRPAEIVQQKVHPERRKKPRRLSTNIAIALACGALIMVVAPMVHNKLLRTNPAIPAKERETSARPLSIHARVQSMTRMAPGEKRLNAAIALAQEIQREQHVPPIEIRHVYFTIADDGRKFLKTKDLLHHIETGLKALKNAGADQHLLSLMYAKKSDLFNRKEEYDEALEAAQTTLSLLKESECKDEELEASAWSNICDAERLKGNNLALKAPQIATVLKQLKEKHYFASYLELAPKLAFIYALNKQLKEEESLFNQSLSFMGERSIQQQLELIQNWLTALYPVAQGNVFQIRLNPWLKSIKPGLSEHEFTAKVVASSTMLLSCGYFRDALEVLQLAKDPDTANGGISGIATDYQIDKARALLWTGNKIEGIREISKLLRSHPDSRASYRQVPLLNLAAACWRSDLPEYVDPLLDHFEKIARNYAELTPKMILFDYNYVLNYVPPGKKPEIGAIYMNRAERLINEKAGRVPRTEQAEIAIRRARCFAQRDQFEKALASIEPMLNDQRGLSDGDLRELHLIKALLLFSLRRDAEAQNEAESYLRSGHNNKVSTVGLYMPLIDMYDVTGKYDKAEHHAKRAIAQASDQYSKVSLAVKLASIYLNEGRPGKAVDLLASISPPKASAITTYLEVGLWLGYHIAYTTALRQQGNMHAAYNQAVLAADLMKLDHRAISARPALDMLTCIYMGEDGADKSRRMNDLLAQSRGLIRESPRGPYFYQCEVFEAILLIEQGSTANGLERLEKALDKCRSAPDTYATVDSFTLAQRVYRKLGKSAQADRCIEDIDKAVQTVRGLRYLKTHDSIKNKSRRGNES